MARQRQSTFSCILQSEFRQEDSKWSYNVNNLPDPKTTNLGRWIKSISLVSSPDIQKLELKYIKVEQNRATTSQLPEHLIHFSFPDFHLGQIVEGQWQKCTNRETADYVAKLLKHGIILNGLLYSFYGHSNSQLKSRSCYLLRGPKDMVTEIVESLGDFSKIKTVAKKVKRIGLLFSSCNAVIQVPDHRYEDIDDIEASGYNFTDGCGMIGTSTARNLSQKMSVIIYNKRYHPSVFQIRFKGYKGVVSEEPRMRKGCWFQFRSSMRKFTGTSDQSFAVVEYSQPYTYGYLNDDIVLLLHALGISTSVFLRKQQEHLHMLRNSLSDPSTAFMLLCSLGRLDLVERLVLSGLETITNSLHGLVSREYTKMLNKKGEKKCRILVPSSRLLFGICDSRAILEEGECFLRITEETSGGLPHTIHNCEVLVTRNPCLHPGDLRKLKAVNRPELAHLKDCIVFAVKGDRPAVDQMSGGDLDGDKFFVCWDPDLVPSIISEAAEYPPGPTPLSFSPIRVDDWIEYFARYTSANLGRVKKLFLEWAIHKGALSRECQELNRLHSLCVDGNRISIPDRLTTLPPKDVGLSERFILNVLHNEAAKNAQIKLSVPTVTTGLDSRDIIETILCQPRTCSEFSMICLVHDWCQKSGQAQICDLLPYFDLSAITSEQLHWLLQVLPPSIGYPSLVMNRLLSSDILAPEELSPFNLDLPGIRWKCIFSANDRMANLFEVFERSFSQFHRKLLVLKIHNRLAVAIYIPQQICPEEEAPVGRTVRVIAFPHTQERDNRHGCIHTTKATYRLYYDHNTFQLYEVARSNTFIWIGRPGKNDVSYRSVKGIANRARERQRSIVAGVNHDWVTSIALNRFSQHVRTQIGRVYRDGIAGAVSGRPRCIGPLRNIKLTTAQELYVISNTDLESFRNLDMWMQSIDTMEVIPLFERVPPPLTIPQLSKADLSSYSKEVRSLFETGDISALDRPQLQSNITSVLQICFEHGESSLPAKIYEHYLQSSQAIAAWLVPEELLEALILGLVYTPGNVVFFARLSPWKEHFCDTLYRSLRAKGLHLLKATIQAANTIGAFAKEAIRIILRDMDSLPLESFQEIVEHICLLSRSPPQVLDIYLDTLESEGERLLDECEAAKKYFMRNMISLAIEHCEEAAESTSGKDELWTFEAYIPSVPVVLTSYRRLDAPLLARLAAGDHVRFELAKYPDNVFWTEKPTFDAIIKSSQRGLVEFRCLTCPPAYNASARWHLKHCGSFVTSKAMFDSLVALVQHKVGTCALYPLLVENKALQNSLPEGVAYEGQESLNECQNQAVECSLTSPLTCIWGPPGTGKTHTVATLLQELLWRRPEDRLLVTAPTHNAVDNILKRYLRVVGMTGTMPLRVTTNIRKVDSSLLKYTCDGMERIDIGESSASRSQAVKRIQQARLIFTTCAGAGLGLLRNEAFQIVIIDEASQQTEPLSLIPLTKGCQKAILVGDHVQLRATVRKYAKTLDFDISLFERLYTNGNIPGGQLRRVMLDLQYRMHPQICEFPSLEFYGGKLKAHVSCERNSLPEHTFPWPKISSSTGDLARCVFVPCSGEEDVGHQSKGNPTQAQLCKEVYRLVASASASIVILTPYTRQVKMLKDCLPSSATVSSIDGFQGQEADVIIYVTVRCNPHGDIGFLNDLRRLNVVLTRARTGLIVIGSLRTLTNAVYPTTKTKDIVDEQLDPLAFESRNVDASGGPVWKRLIQSLHKVDVHLPSK